MEEEIEYRWAVGEVAYYNDGYEGEEPKMKWGRITGIASWCLYPTYLIKGNPVREDQIHTARIAPTPAMRHVIEFLFYAPESVEDDSFFS